MLLTISTTREPATDLGYLLHKHPDRVQRFPRAFGVAHVFYPEATDQRCTAALLLDVDPVRLARTRGKSTPDFSLGQYVNDRPYAASSLLSTAMAEVFRTARAGRCDARPELAQAAIPLEIVLPALPCRGGPTLARRLFEPMGWDVTADPIPLDPAFPEWGDSRYVTLTLKGELRLADALNHLYVLLPVLDDAKHYWIAEDEVDKLIRAGEGWLAAHPDLTLITRRFLNRRTALTRAAFARLAEVGDDEEETLEPPAEEEVRIPLNTLRRDAVVSTLAELQARSVIDLGCGSGQLISALLDQGVPKITGVDVSAHTLMIAARRLRLDRMGSRTRERVDLFQGSVTYTDARFAGYDAAVLMEVVEHLDPPRLPAMERVVFGTAKPTYVLVTTPNAEYNPRYENLTGLRHPDHRFEWTRAEFRDWAGGVAGRYGYQVEHRPVGDDDPEVGSPTQMAVFTKEAQA
ncbi:3' terminal RNA ribose 2'-O-methyltransferase Hen1 [Herbidospora sp. NBRC 101105]|uniref:3' terminal RNA ribose 2'-O-methyltransferase Hen1 n=1 Tax=Herbidospora sp. NBRC 101105 TaxID=3032195 RepID=UPI0024A50CD2|nr:3' terminal RNA ribose 2'-O-methyltransferase Hen1 [Herbidospora sp. NBRC 101105]GLX94373.1 3' terminal RNA ribose 2'-O-methyltransferase Hen1 [Herbidospora sp. NBRC 101105]